ncbi:hypothetical protein [Spirosoma koreense]
MKWRGFRTNPVGVIDPTVLKSGLERNRIRINPFGSLFLLLGSVGLLSCQANDQLTGVAAGASGRYIVTAYVVSEDTLFSLVRGSTGYKPGINKIGVDNFTVAMDVIGSDQLSVRTDYWRNGLQSTFSKEVFVSLTNYDYQFSLLKANGSSGYEGRVGRFTGFFYERTVGGLVIPLAGSSTIPKPSSPPDVVIVAQPAE